MTQSDSPEFLAILERVPRWHMLTPGEQIKDGDKIWQPGDQVSGVWRKVIAIGTVNSRPFRRHIPEHVRRSEAWWALYNQLATIKPDKRGWLMGHDRMIPERTETPDAFEVFAHVVLVNYGLPKFTDDLDWRDAIDILGGEAEIIKNLQEGPGAYMRWVLGGTP